VIVPYVMPGFRLAKLAAEMFEGMPAANGMVLLKHGLFTFASDARESYERTIEYVDRAEAFLRKRARSKAASRRRGAAPPPPQRGCLESDRSCAASWRRAERVPIDPSAASSSSTALPTICWR